MTLAVAIGAFGAHGLKPLLSAYHLDIFKTANFYHFIHGLALFITIILSVILNQTKILKAFIFFIVGILLFSGSLYTLALQSVFENIPGWMGAITPFGGLSFIIGWVLLGYFGSRNK